jgi:hypothetical protein
LEPRIVPADIGIVALVGNRNEGNGGTTPFTFSLIRGGDLSGPSSVTYAVTGSGSSPASAADFGGTFPSGTVHFDVGQGRSTLTIPVSGDGVDEANEQFTVTLTPGANANLTTASATGTIIDDDGPVLVVSNANDSGPGSLRAVMAAAAPGSIVTFALPANSVIALTSGQIEIPAGRNLIVDGSAAANLTISGSNASRIFLLDSSSVQPTTLTVRGLTLADGDAGTGSGGAIGTAGELHTLTVENVTFRDNKSGEGGAIDSVWRGSLTVTNCTFLRNEGIRTDSELGAGAIYFLGPNSLVVTGSTFDGNRGINGGAIKTIAGRVDIENSTFRNNDVLAARFDTGQPNDSLRGYGGAVMFDRASSADDTTGGTLIIRNCLFKNNTGRSAGGAVYLYTGDQDALEIDSCSFVGNQTVGLINANGDPEGEGGDGGAIELQSDSINRGLIVANSSFTGNRAVDRGGAIRMRNFPGQIYNNTFHDNRTTLAPTAGFVGGLGGAIEMDGGTAVQVFVRNNTFAENYATWTGGAILAGVMLRADNNIFDRNTTDTFANGNPILSHVDGSNLSGTNNIQSTSNRGQSNNQAIPGGTTTADPMLFLPANNGGPTLTQTPQTGSAAINAGSNPSLPPDLLDADGDGNYSEPVPFDQRGSGFPRLVGGTVDVGALETGTVPPPPPHPFHPAVRFAVAAGGGSGVVTTFDAAGTPVATTTPFDPVPPGGIRVAVADVNGDGTDDLVVGTGPGVPSQVRVLDGTDGHELFAVDPFEASFLGGVYVAAGDLDGDGKSEILVSPDEGGGPRVRIFAGAGFAQVADFFGIDDPNFRGGARIAVADVTGDGQGDLLVAAGFGGGPRVAAFDGRSLANGRPTKPFSDFFVFEPTLRNGVFIAGGDLDGDGYADVIVGGGPGGGPRVFALSGQALLTGHSVQMANFFAGDTADRGGVRITVKNLDGDGRDDLVTASGPGAAPVAVAYAGKNVAANGTPAELLSLTPFDVSLQSGIFVG